jgi:hypothetical protein
MDKNKTIKKIIFIFYIILQEIIIILIDYIKIKRFL